MSDVIDFVGRARERDLSRRKLTEPPAAVVLLTEGGKIAAWANGLGEHIEDVWFGEDHEVQWQPFSIAREIAQRLRERPSAQAMAAAGFRIEAVRI
jgi:hypothetical protein